MVELTVGQVAGLIALAIFISRVLFPNILTFILAVILKDKETAATWNVAGRTLHNSYWPDVMRSDAAQSYGVRKTVLFTTTAVPLMAILVAIAGVVTPLGLYEVLEPSGLATRSFSYVKDVSPFGASTLPPISNFTRTCSMGHGWGRQGPAPCPYTNNSIIFAANDSSMSWTFVDDHYDMAVPQIIKDIYSSGTRGTRSTISNYFDIQWRAYNQVTDTHKEDGKKPFYVGDYRTTRSLIMDEEILLIEGLVVDSVKGGIGFRNHTLPEGLSHGASWEEDLLFIEPETACVDTNLTLDFVRAFARNTGDPIVSDFWLTDRGGFVNLNQTYPVYDHDNAQNDPDLRNRAYKAAWLNNVWTMAYMNVTTFNDPETGLKAFSYLNSEMGKQFPFSPSVDIGQPMLSVRGQFLYYVTDPSGGGNYSNPWKLTSTNYSSINVLCEGASATDYANITNIKVGCGLVQGTPRRVDGGPDLAFEGGSKWTAPLYSCATAVKATVKTVTFLLNGTASGLDALGVTNITDKQYDSPDSWPLWGMEDSGLTLDGISPVWGLIAPEYAKFPNISTVRKPSLYLVGGGANLLSSSTGLYQYQNLPGSDIPSAALSSIFAGNSRSLTTVSSTPDYSGKQNLAMYVRWQKMSSNVDDVASVIDLMWTDIAAQGVAGTKGTQGSFNDPNDAVGRLTVRPIVRKIKYHYVYGIPAFILAACLLIIAITAIATAIVERAGLNTMKMRLQQSSTGRIMTTLLHPDQSDLKMSSKEWSRSAGKTPIDLSNGGQGLTGRKSPDADAQVSLLNHPVRENKAWDPSYSPHIQH